MKIPKSASGMFRVTLARTFPHEGFTFKPSTTPVVDRATLDAMIAADAVHDVAAA